MKFIPVILFFLLVISAKEPGFTVKEEHVTTTINTDSTVHFVYHLTIHTTEGPQKGIYLGIPTDAVCEYTASQAGEPLKVEKEPKRLKIWFLKEAQSGDTTELDVQFTAEGLLYTNGKTALTFYPCWWERQSVDNLCVTVVLPRGCPLSEVESSPAADTQNIENECVLISYQRNQVTPGYKLQITVSFPHQYLTAVTTTQTEPHILWVIIGIAVTVVLLLWIKKQKGEPAYGETLLYDSR
jgi:hypothetical protein